MSTWPPERQRHREPVVEAAPLLDGDHVAADVAATLAALGRPRAHRGRNRPVPGAPLQGWLHRRSSTEVADWLGFPPPAVRRPSPPGDRVVFATSWSGPLPIRGAILASTGEAPSLDVYSLSVPPTVSDPDLTSMTVQEWRAAGVITVQVHAGPRPWTPSPPGTRLQGTSGGFTTVSFRGVQIGVQNQGPALTRLAWITQVGQETFNVTVHIPLDPLPAARLLATYLDHP